MSLNIGGTGKSKPYAKYNAKADKWFARGPDGEDREIPRPTFVADFDNIATGWIRLLEGQAPERLMDISVRQSAPCPGEGFKRGFVLAIYSPKFFGGAVEFSSASIHLSNAVKDIYVQYEAGREANPGKLPVVSCIDSEAMKDRYGTNYRPIFAIVQWVDRPPGLPDASPVDAGEVYHGPPTPTSIAPTPAQHVAAPSQPPAPPASDPLAEPLF
jgi:hypothetical protein